MDVGEIGHAHVQVQALHGSGSGCVVQFYISGIIEQSSEARIAF
jgi:hypothetical protein